MADHDIEGQVRVLLRLLTSAAGSKSGTSWPSVLSRLRAWGCPRTLRMQRYGSFCQTQQIILITGNRNKAGPEALEAVIEQNNTPTSLPVLTIGVPPRVLSSRAYAERVATCLLEVLLDVEQYRGTGRLYLP